MSSNTCLRLHDKTVFTLRSLCLHNHSRVKKKCLTQSSKGRRQKIKTLGMRTEMFDLMCFNNSNIDGSKLAIQMHI